MDPNIILSGRGPNVFNAWRQGADAAQQQIANGQQNALAPVQLQQAQQGVQMNALAMDQTRQNMQFSAEEMQMRRTETARLVTVRIEAKRGQIDAAAVAAEGAAAEAFAASIGAMYAAGNRAGYDSVLRAKGIDPATMPFDQAPAFLAQYMGVADAIKMFTPAPVPQVEPMSPEGKVALDQRRGFLTDEQRDVALGGSTETIFGPDGNPIVTRGNGVRPFTEAQSKDNVFATRATGALATLEPVAEALTGRGDVMLDVVPLGIGREAQGDAYQVAKQAGDEFLMSILRKDTGAAITPSEQRIYGDTFLPRPGDGPAVLVAKKQSRARAVAALKAGMSVDQIMATEKALISSVASVERATTDAPGKTQPVVIDGFTIEAVE